MRCAGFLVVFGVQARTIIVVVNANGTFAPARADIFSGDTVEWQFPDRRSAIIPVAFDPSAPALCTNYLPYDPSDPNEFTGPMPRAVSGIFALSPEDSPYACSNLTWQTTNLTGVFIRMRWDSVQQGTNQFDWSEMDAEIEKAVANGKVYSLGFKAGSHGTPQWIFNVSSNNAVVTPMDFGFSEPGQSTDFVGSPADTNYVKHYLQFLHAVAAHIRSNNAHYRAMSAIKICGLNLHTHENRLINDTPEQLANWAANGHYTPSALFSFYDKETALFATEFTNKDMSYALIQDGFPVINDCGEYAGQSEPTNYALPGGTVQTDAVMYRGRTNHGLSFLVQHNGLQPAPDFCPGSGMHPIVVSNGFHFVGSGCPNKWVLEQLQAGQVTGFQVVAGITNLADLESALTNEWDNSDGIFLEVYQGNALSAISNGLPSGRNLGDWNEMFHQRRRGPGVWTNIADPFPLKTAYQNEFLRAR